MQAVGAGKMRVISVLVGAVLLLAGVMVGYPAVLGELLGDLFGTIGLPDLAIAVARQLDVLRGVVAQDLPVLLIAAGFVLLLAGSFARPAATAPRPEMELVLDLAGTAPKFVVPGRWEAPGAEPMAGTVYRVGVRNRSGAALPAVIVTILLPGTAPSSARFVKDGSYCAGIGAGAMELVEVFMMRDADIAAGKHIKETLTLRATAPGMRTVERRYRFDSRAKAALVEA